MIELYFARKMQLDLRQDGTYQLWDLPAFIVRRYFGQRVSQ